MRDGRLRDATHSLAADDVDVDHAAPWELDCEVDTCNVAEQPWKKQRTIGWLTLLCMDQVVTRPMSDDPERIFTTSEYRDLDSKISSLHSSFRRP